MQIVPVEPDDRNFLCPLTGEKNIYGDDQHKAPTLRGGWCHVTNQLINLAEELKSLWQKCLAAQEATKGVLDITAIVPSLGLAKQAAFEITTRRMVYGPVWSQEWTLLELNSPDELQED